VRLRLTAAWPREAATLSGKLMGPWEPSWGKRRRIVFAYNNRVDVRKRGKGKVTG
jgi:hypothetical protein